MPIDMYDQSLCEHLFHRDKRQPFTKARQAEVQASYYQRRGWFYNKKRMLFKLLQLDAKQFAPIESMEELDAFAKQYLMDKYQLDIPICPTLFLMKCAKHIKGSTLNNPTKGNGIPIKGSNPTCGNGIPINNPLETPETLPQA